MPIRPYSTSDLELKPSIEKRAEELHLPKSGEKPAEAQKRESLLDRVPGGALSVIPVVGPQLQMAYDAARALNPNLNITVQDGSKANKIKQLAGDTSLIKSHDGRTNKYEKLGTLDRVLYGITDDNVTNETIYQNSERIKDSDEYKALDTKDGRPLRDKVMQRGSLASGRDLVNAKEGYDERTGLRKSVRGMEGGIEALKGLDSLPSAAELREIEARLAKLQPDYVEARASEVRAGETHERAGELNTQNIASMKSADATAKGTLTLAQTKAENELIQQQFENEYRTGKLAHDAAEADKLRAFTASENAAQRATQMEINLLGREDTREQREYDRSRDERQDRQLMIMQMMKGLQQLGGSFAI